MIFDRSYIDIINARKVFANKVQSFRELAEPEQRIIDRAFFNLTALNRITAKINEIWELVVSLGGVKVEIADVREWSNQEIFTITNFSNIRGNIGEILSQIHEWSFVDIQLLQDAYETINDDYSYTNLNTLEKLLYDIYNELENANIELESNYLTFSSPTSFTLSTNNSAKNWDGTLEYSTDTVVWKIWSGTTALSADNGKLYLRGVGNTRLALSATAGLEHRWKLNGTDISCEGNIESLLDYDTVTKGGHPPMAAGCFNYLFYGNPALISAPSLPATTLSERCYFNLFLGTGIVKAPELPATTLAFQCYFGMFESCQKLKIPPKLPATNLADECYKHMFQYCTNLIIPPVLPATILARECYYSMFTFCTMMMESPELPATVLAEDCYNSMFSYCDSLTTIPMLPANDLKPRCYFCMFIYCRNVRLSMVKTTDYATEYRIPASGIGTVGEYALAGIFLETGGTFTGDPSINRTYYTSNTVV